MRFKLEIDMDNDAFKGPTSSSACEIRTIIQGVRLAELIGDVRRYRSGQECKLRDSNGNTVGFARVTED